MPVRMGVFLDFHSVPVGNTDPHAVEGGLEVDVEFLFDGGGEAPSKVEVDFAFVERAVGRAENKMPPVKQRPPVVAELERLHRRGLLRSICADCCGTRVAGRGSNLTVVAATLA